MQAKFFNSFKCNQKVETFDLANLSESDNLESDRLQNKLISEEIEEGQEDQEDQEDEEEISPLKESTYNNCNYFFNILLLVLPDLLKFKKNLQPNLQNHVSIDNYKRSNVARENILKNKYKQLETTLKKKSIEKNDLIAEVCKLQESIKVADEALSREKEEEEKETVKNKLPAIKQKHSSIFNVHLKRRDTTIDPNEKFNKFIIPHQHALKKVQFSFEKTKIIENLNAQKIEKKTLLQKLQVELKKLKSELKVIRNKLLKHYYDILKVGLDRRKKGLTWVIKEIFILKGILKLSDMPEYLDQLTVSYLCTITKLNMDLDKIFEEKYTVLSNARINKNSDVNKINDMMILFNTSLNNDLDFIKTQSSLSTQAHSFNSSRIYSYSDKSSISPHLSPIKNNSLYKSQSGKLHLNIKHVSQFFDKKIQLTEDSQRIIQIINNLDTKAASIIEEIKKLKEKEMNRIRLEFFKNNYERRFSCDKKTLLEALIGDEETPKELVRQLNQQKVYILELEKCRNFLPFLKI